MGMPLSEAESKTVPEAREIRTRIERAIDAAVEARTAWVENVKKLEKDFPLDDVLVDQKTLSVAALRNAWLHEVNELGELEEQLRASLNELPMNRIEQKEQQIDVLRRDHERALEEFFSSKEERESRKGEAFQIHVTCMDERDTFASEATGEPLGSMELFASPGGKVTPEKLVELYGKQLAEARAAGKELAVYLMPHTCGADNHAGCAAFKTDEKAQEAYFSQLADGLRARPEFAGTKIVTAFYDTDSHEMRPFHGSMVSKQADDAAVRLRSEKGEGKEEAKGDWDRAHAGNRIYVGDLPRAWTARRNAAYHLHSGMDRQELVDGIALAVKVIKVHSHVDLASTPIVIQLDAALGSRDAFAMSDEDILMTLNASPNLADAALKVHPEEVMIIRTQTNPETWEGTILGQETMQQAA